MTDPIGTAQERELPSKLRNLSATLVRNDDAAICWAAADALQSRIAEVAELRAERDALLEEPISFAKMDSIDEDASGKMVAYYWYKQAQEARAALSQHRKL